MVQVSGVHQSPYKYPNSQITFAGKNFRESIILEAADNSYLSTPNPEATSTPALLFSASESVIITNIEAFQTGTELVSTAILIYSLHEGIYYCLGQMNTDGAVPSSYPVDSLDAQLPALLYGDGVTTRGLKMPAGDNLYVGISNELDNPVHIVITGRSYNRG